MVKKGVPTALETLMTELMKTEQTEFYKQMISPLENEIPEITSNYGNNIQQWIQGTDAKLREEYSVADNELRSATSVMIKESIRQAMLQIINIYLRWGKLEDAQKELLRSRDFCSSPSQHITLHLQLVSVAIHLGHVINAINFVHKVNDLTADPEVTSRTKVAQALCCLHNQVREKKRVLDPPQARL